ILVCAVAGGAGTLVADGPNGPGPDPYEGLHLDGRTFVSTSVVEGGTKHVLVPGTRIRLSFENRKIRVDAGCHVMTARYVMDGLRLAVNGLAMTDKTCDTARSNQDEWVASILTSEPELKLSGTTLVLRGTSTVLTFGDRTVVQPDRPLRGTHWRVESLI